MKYIVGYPVSENPSFTEAMLRNKEHISEVYFSWGDLPNGRCLPGEEDSMILFQHQMRQHRDLKRLSDAGVKLNLLLNANCYGRDSQSRAFFNKLGNLIDFLRNELCLASVTTASPLIAKFVKDNFEALDTRASVNMEIGSIEGISYLTQYFDSFYVKRELNRNLRELERIAKWCGENGKQMYLLANSGCLNNCSAHIFHDNLVAHEGEISAMDNGYRFQGICWEFLAAPEHFEQWLQRTNFIRPEDMALYESLVPAVKLATRINSAPARVLEAYVKGSYRGSVMELLEPNHSGAVYPRYIENSMLDASFASHVMCCDKQCETCHYCADVMKRACIRLSDDPSIQV